MANPDDVPHVSHYTSEVLRHARFPQNVGDLDAPDGVAELTGGTITMRISVRVADGVIKDVAFRSSTCVVAIAACSQLTMMAKGLSADEAMAITAEALATALREIPAHRMDRCELAVSVLRAALAHAADRPKLRNGLQEVAR